MTHLASYPRQLQHMGGQMERRLPSSWALRLMLSRRGCRRRFSHICTRQVVSWLKRGCILELFTERIVIGVEMYFGGELPMLRLQG